MVRKLSYFDGSLVVDVVSVFKVDDSTYVQCWRVKCPDKWNSLRGWIGRRTGRQDRLTVMEEVFLGQFKWDCAWCGKDQHACSCEVDQDGLVWVNGSVGVPFEDSDLPF